jgi:serine/threonine protein kinase
MTPDRWRQVEALYHEALTRKGEAQAAFLAEACVGDVALRREVESLLAQVTSGPLATGGAAAFVSDPRNASVVGRRFGVYQIQALLGTGGMGEVYKAGDTRLGRDVALKILPRVFTSDPDRLARFEREARLLAALNHPHIATIHGLEESDGVRALVMEFVEGPTLADRIAKGAVPISEALAIARQIAEALEAAHEKGIVHRDLKPANIKFTREGAVKVLDFGLAKATPVNHEDTDSLSASSMTHEGMILGTAAYMSPEQARGLRVDTRTDIWAFGCVLYEMLVGRAAFARGSVSDTIAAVLERNPDWQTLPPNTTPALRRLVERCLEKDLRKRRRDIGDIRSELDEPMLQTVLGPSPAAAASRTHAMRAAIVGAVVMLLVALGVALGIRSFNNNNAAIAISGVGRFTIRWKEKRWREANRH